jgi:hypothetical protein
MSDEKRREELKAIINEQLDKLSIEDLEKVAGGGEGWWGSIACDKCNSINIIALGCVSSGKIIYRCKDCGNFFEF